MTNCPCGTGKAYADCCGVFISGEKTAPTPEALMRSRYTAYHQLNIDYIAKTMQSPAADQFDAKAASEWAQAIQLFRLEVLNSSMMGSQGFVEFVAHYLMNGEKHILHEKSEFKFENGQWFYVDGVKPGRQLKKKEKIGRNDGCICGSGKKYKKCCG